MCPVIRISDDTFALLQEVAKPLVDTPDTAINRVLNAYLKKPKIQTPPMIGGGARRVPVGGGEGFDPSNPPDLTHSSFLSGSVDGVPVEKWNYLVLQAHEAALKRLNGNVMQLTKLSAPHITQGRNTDKGFHSARNGQFSVQAVDANKAWKLAVDLARQLDIEIYAEFRWQQKPTAAYPGRVGSLSWIPQSRNRLESRATGSKATTKGGK